MQYVINSRTVTLIWTFIDSITNEHKKGLSPTQLGKIVSII